MSEATHCAFCKIAAGSFAATKVYEDEYTMAFMDIQPASPGHTLVIPKNHAANLLEIAEVDLLATTKTVQKIARALSAALQPDGMRMIQTNGAAAGQSVFHYHVHLIPMQEGQRLNIHGRELAKPEELQALAARIRGALAA